MIVIYGIRETLNPIKATLSDVIHASLVAVLGLPEDKRIQRFMPMDADNFYYPSDRSTQYTIIEINMMEGRTIETKKALIKRLFTSIESTLGIKPIDVEITIHEQPKHCWGFRGITGDEANTLSYKVDV
ncbi:tautomerase family protein [Psychrosphaera sp. 1_MG-2023]|uniref:tautomerase family protein n=1 Tax=Psychrosphaera sp. 1_MG-2023 TaxID=3062643 RepID=UPI0026E34CC1|nr:tautomerase family protein [Psychrosphaera sp. 1_MG-2023]MDO6720487.1 tautomerase family protein [Psychrosphaera sp. 1_MG-2023]